MSMNRIITEKLHCMEPCCVIEKTLTMTTKDSEIHVLFIGEKCNIATNLKRTPPIGAPKATETPAAEAAERISLFFASFLPYLGKR